MPGLQALTTLEADMLDAADRARKSATSLIVQVEPVPLAAGDSDLSDLENLDLVPSKEELMRQVIAQAVREEASKHTSSPALILVAVAVAMLLLERVLIWLG
jgi:hypothetical protein